MTDFSLDNLLHELYDMFSFRALRDKTVEIVYSNRNSDLIIHSDERMLRQILTNLIGNALKFTQEGKVEFGFRLENSNILLYVKDTGIGISKDKQEMIFEPFRQAEDSISRTFGGTGLGLSIARSYARFIGGELTLDSEPGVGSEFMLTIPAKTGINIIGRSQESVVEVKDYDWNGRHILVVEDDKISFLFLNKILSGLGGKVIHAESGYQAVNICKERLVPVDIILMDVILPDINGINAASEIRAFDKNTPIVLQTADIMLVDKNKCGDCYDALLSKPIRKSELVETLDKLMCVHGVS